MSTLSANEPNLLVKSARLKVQHKTFFGIRPSVVPSRAEPVTRSYPDYLTPRHKLSAIDIKRKDDLRENRSRNRSILIQRLLAKFGPKLLKRITDHVDQLLVNRKDGSFDDKDVKLLEDAIMSSQQSRPRTADRPPTAPNVPSSAPGTVPQMDFTHFLGTHPPTQRSQPSDCGGGCMTPIPEGAKWRAVQMYQTLLAEDESRAKASRKAEVKKKMYDALAEQVATAEVEKEAEARREREYRDRVYTDIEKYNEEKAEEALRKEQLNSSLRATWQKQIDISKDKCKAAREDEIMKDNEMLRRTQTLIEESARLAKAKRENAASVMKSVIETNLENEKVRAIREKEQIEDDKRIAQQYREMIEEKNRMKEGELNRRREKLEKMRAWAEATMAPLGEEETAKWKLLDERIKEEEQQIREAEEKRRAKLEADEASLCLLLRVENEALMNQKKKEDEEFRRLTLENGARIRQEVEEFKEYMRQKRLTEAEERKKYGSDLLMQMVDLESEKEMTPVEESLNKEALQAVSSDPSFHSRIVHRLRMSGLPTPRASSRHMVNPYEPQYPSIVSGRSYDYANSIPRVLPLLPTPRNRPHTADSASAHLHSVLTARQQILDVPRHK